MSLDDLLEPPVLIAVGVTAAIMSPPVRRVLHQGLVYGLAGILTVSDKVTDAARGMSQRARRLTESRADGHHEANTATAEAAG
jgi:hypothetical protein